MDSDSQLTRSQMAWHDTLTSLQDAVEIDVSATQALNILDDVTDKLIVRSDLSRKMQVTREDLSLARNILERITENAREEKHRLAEKLTGLAGGCDTSETSTSSSSSDDDDQRIVMKSRWGKTDSGR